MFIKILDIDAASWFKDNSNYTGIAEIYQDDCFRNLCRTEYFVNGQYHRTDGPAVFWSNGAEEWYQNGKLHRTDGPAFFHAPFFGGVGYYLNGVPFDSPEEFLENLLEEDQIKFIWNLDQWK